MQITQSYTSYFKKIWMLENPSSVCERKTGVMVGDGRLELVFVAGGGYKAVFDDGHTVFCRPGMYVGGHLNAPFELEVLPETKIMFIKLEPWTAGLLSGIDFSQSMNQTLSLVDVNKTLNSKLHHIDYFNSSAVLQILGNEFEANQARFNDMNLIKYGCQLLEHQYATFKSAKQAIVQQTGLSPKTLESKFGRHVGLTPKKFANTVRFRNITEAIIHSQSPFSLTALAHEHGYFDQAHFTKDCKRFLGISPKQLSPDNCFITNSEEAFRFYTI